MASRLSQAGLWLRKNGPGIGVQVAVNAVLPLLIYDFTNKQLGDVKALLASSIPPILWSVIEFIRHRRLDALSALVLTGIALSLLAFLGGGGAKFLQLREALVGGLIGTIFLVSVAVRRPLFYYVIRATLERSSAEEAARFEQVRDDPGARRTIALMTLVWGLGLVAHTTVSCVLVFSLPIATYLAVSPVVGYAFTGGLIGWSVYYGRLARKRGDERRAAEAAAAEAQYPSPQGTLGRGPPQAR